MSASKKLLGRLVDWLYPSVCAACESPLAGVRSLCAACDEGLPRVAAPFCDVCCEPFCGQIDGPFACPNCHEVSFHFEFARCAMDRSEALLRMIHGLKYQRQVFLAEELGRLACGAFQDRRLAVARDENWPLVPVPLHWRRMRMREFNQAQEIARVVARETGLSVARLLRRTEATPTQTRLSRRERMANLKNAFTLAKRADPAEIAKLPGVILIDDVLTTGSTVDACAKVLRKAGAVRVAVLTVMRG